MDQIHSGEEGESRSFCYVCIAPLFHTTVLCFVQKNLAVQIQCSFLSGPYSTSDSQEAAGMAACFLLVSIAPLFQSAFFSPRKQIWRYKFSVSSYRVLILLEIHSRER